MMSGPNITTTSSIPFSSSNNIPIPTPPSSSGSNRAPSQFGRLSSPKFVHPARRRGSADSYNSVDDDLPIPSAGRSPSYSYNLTAQRSQGSPRLGSSPGARLVIRSNSTGTNYTAPGSPSYNQPQNQSPRLRQTPKRNNSIPAASLNDLDFDVEPLSPYSYLPYQSPLPPSRKNSRDDAYSHVQPPAHVDVLTQRLRDQQRQEQQRRLKEQREREEQERGIQLHMMPKNMLLPLPDRNAEMKHLMDHNKTLMKQIRRALGEEDFALVTDLWTRTRRSEISDHEWLRRSRYFLVEKIGAGGGERVWSEWCMMVGWDHSRDLKRDENGVVRPVEEYADKIGHMQCLEEEEE